MFAAKPEAPGSRSLLTDREANKRPGRVAGRHPVPSRLWVKARGQGTRTGAQKEERRTGAPASSCRSHAVPGPRETQDARGNPNVTKPGVILKT